MISVLSHKVSGAATCWPTIEQEDFAIYFSVKKLEYLLMCKAFVVETDHRNLVWMGTSLVAKIIRWRIYLQGFNMTIRHIKGNRQCNSGLAVQDSLSDFGARGTR